MKKFFKFASHASFSLALAICGLVAFSGQNLADEELFCGWYKIFGTDYLVCGGKCILSYANCVMVPIYNESGYLVGIVCDCLN